MIKYIAFMDRLFFTIISVVFPLLISAQCTIISESGRNAVPKHYGWGHHTIRMSASNIPSLKLEEGAIAILFEAEGDLLSSARSKTLIASGDNINIGFIPQTLVVINNPGNRLVVAFEHSNFKGKSILYPDGLTPVAAEFGISSLYVPDGSKVELAEINPELRADHAGRVKSFASGIHLFVGDNINDAARYVQVSNTQSIIRESVVSNAPPAKPSVDISRQIDRMGDTHKNQLGNPLAVDNGILNLGIGDWRYKQFSRGIVYGSPTKGVYALFGRIFMEYVKNADGPFGRLGMPQSEIFESANYRACVFESGVIIENKIDNTVNTYFK